MAPTDSHLPYQPRCQWKAPLPSEASIYTPLDANHFRLLALDGYTSQGALRCSLHTVAHGETNEYTALSYTWNEADRIWYGDHSISPKPIWVHGKLVQVSHKVANILCLAKQHGKSLVWIDAICIDQSNAAEKGHQVSQMGKLYSGATDVLCFLNRPTAETDKTMETIRLYSQNNMWMPEYEAWFTRLLRDDYWTRAWTLQETVLAKTAFLCCGSKIASLSEFTAFKKKIDEDNHWGWREVPSNAKAVYQLIPDFYNYVYHAKNPDETFASRQITADAGFLEILRKCRAANSCTDARDLIYSRLALSSESSRLVPYPDYTISVEELYARFATNCILLTGSLEIITFATNTARGLPSWIPDWTSVNHGWKLSDGLTETKKAMESLIWKDIGLPRISHCRTELKVQGRILYVVREEDSGYEKFLSRILKHTAHGEAYVPFEIPKAGDLGCVLRNCPAFVFLRPFEDFYRIVGRNAFTQSEFKGPKTCVSRNVGVNDALQDAGALPEYIFKIR